MLFCHLAFRVLNYMHAPDKRERAKHKAPHRPNYPANPLLIAFRCSWFLIYKLCFISLYMHIWMYAYICLYQHVEVFWLTLGNFAASQNAGPSIVCVFFSHTHTNTRTHRQTTSSLSLSLCLLRHWPSSSASKSNNNMPANRHNNNDKKFLFYFLHLFTGTLPLTLTLTLTSTSTLTSPSAWGFVVVSFYKNIFFCIFAFYLRKSGNSFAICIIALSVCAFFIKCPLLDLSPLLLAARHAYHKTFNLIFWLPE